MLVPLFVPHLGCESICTYCNQGFITGIADPKLEREIQKVPVSGSVKLEIGLYGGNILGLKRRDLQRLFRLLDPVMDRIECVNISTKPRTLDKGTVELLGNYKVRKIELGIPTFNDSILERVGRNHSVADLLHCYEAVKTAGFECALQVMVGLPEESFEDVKRTASYILLLRPSYVRIYPLVVLKGTRLYESYLDGTFVPVCFEEGLKRALFIYLCCLKDGIRVANIGLTDGKTLREMVAGGLYHPCFGFMVKAEALFQAILLALEGKGIGGEIEVFLDRSEIPHLFGYKGWNMERLERHGIRVKVRGEEMEKGSFLIKKGRREVMGHIIDTLSSPIFR